MRFNPLGSRSGIEVTDVGLGLWAVAGSEWGPGEDQASLDAIEVALDAGITFFDTADVYGEGHSEELLGQAMAGRRERFIVASKIGWTGFDRDANHSQYDSVSRLVDGVEGSLRRFDTDLSTSSSVTSTTSSRTPTCSSRASGPRSAGKVRAWGVSTSDFDHLRYVNADGDCDVLQIDYSILNRTAERRSCPTALASGIGVIVRGPLAMGLLAGKFSASDTFADGDFRANWINDPEQNEQYLQRPRGRRRPQLCRSRRAVDGGVRPAVRAQPSSGEHGDPGSTGRTSVRGNAAAGLAPLLSRGRACGRRSHRSPGWRTEDLARLIASGG